jgi:sporulation protein YunB
VYFLRYRYSRKGKFFTLIVILSVLLIYGFIVVDRNIKPTVLALSEVKARVIATQAINDAVKTKLKDDVRYKDLIFVKYDKEGRVTMMQANTVLMNSIASDVALEVQENIRQIATRDIKIPLGNAFKSQLLAQWGPKIKIDIVPQGTVNVDFTTEFEESGINQTRHKIYLVVITDVKIIIPLASETIRIATNIPIAETVIVGDVPESYINVPEEEFLNVVD